MIGAARSYKQPVGNYFICRSLLPNITSALPINHSEFNSADKTNLQHSSENFQRPKNVYYLPCTPHTIRVRQNTQLSASLSSRQPVYHQPALVERATYAPRPQNEHETFTGLVVPDRLWLVHYTWGSSSRLVGNHIRQEKCKWPLPSTIAQPVVPQPAIHA